MTQDERWITKYNEVMVFIETNHRNPSRHRLEEHDLLNWLKATRKRFFVNQFFNVKRGGYVLAVPIFEVA